MEVSLNKRGIDHDVVAHDINYVTIELQNGIKYDIEFKYGELYIRKTGSHLSDEINIVPKASNVISLK